MIHQFKGAVRGLFKLFWKGSLTAQCQVKLIVLRLLSIAQNLKNQYWFFLDELAISVLIFMGHFANSPSNQTTRHNSLYKKQCLGETEVFIAKFWEV